MKTIAQTSATAAAQARAISRRNLCVSAASLLLVARARATEIQSQPAAAFIDSVGVGTHITIDPYTSLYPQFRQLLKASGIRHVREELRPANNLDRWRDLQASTGIRWQLVVSPITNTVEQMLARIDALGVGNFTAVEGQNEGDAAWFVAQEIANGNWSQTVVDYQRAIFNAVRGRYTAAALAVVSPTLLDWKPRDVALIRDCAPFCDIVALHSYVQGGQEPETSDDHAALAWYIRNYRDTFKPGAPVMVTETGYTNSNRHGALSERAISIYLPRLLLHNFSAGVVRTFIYEFMDGGVDPANNEHHYGLVRYDGTPKPSYHAVASLMAAMRQDASVPASQPPLGGLRGVIPDAPRDMRQLTLSHPDGTVVVALWRPLRAWNPLLGGDIFNPTVNVTLAADKAVRRVDRLLPNGDGKWTKLELRNGQASFAIGDSVTLIRLSGANA